MSTPNTEQTVDLERIRAGLGKARRASFVSGFPQIALLVMLLALRWFGSKGDWGWLDWFIAVMIPISLWFQIVGYFVERKGDLLHLSGAPGWLLAHYQFRLRVVLKAMSRGSTPRTLSWFGLVLLAIGLFGEHDGFTKPLAALSWTIPLLVALSLWWYDRYLGHQLQVELNALPPAPPPGQELSNRVQALLPDRFQNGLNQNKPKETALTDEESKAVAGLDQTYDERLASVSRKISECVADGDKIQAIKLWREITGAGLAAAKAAIEKLLAESAAPAAHPGGADRPSA